MKSVDGPYLQSRFVLFNCIDSSIYDVLTLKMSQHKNTGDAWTTV